MDGSSVVGRKEEGYVARRDDRVNPNDAIHGRRKKLGGYGRTDLRAAGSGDAGQNVRTRFP
jgi:hypothetical protein